MKNVISVFLAIVLVFSVSVVVPAAMIIGDEGEQSMEAFIYLPGQITETSNESIHVRSSIDESIVVVNITAETFVVDAISGLNTTIAERTGDIVSVYHSPVMTRSYPPITNAFAVITSIPADFHAPRYTIVEDVEEYDGDTRIITDRGGLIITISHDTQLTEEVITSRGEAFDKANIREGDRLLLYYVAVLMSHPAQATARKAVYLEHGEVKEPQEPQAPYGTTEQTTAEPEEYPVPTGGFSLAASRSFEQDGATWVPLREVAEALGMEVEWNAEERSVAVSYNDTKSTIRIGYDGELRDNLTYVSIAFFRDVLDVTSQRLADVIVFYK